MKPLSATLIALLSLSCFAPIANAGEPTGGEQAAVSVIVLDFKSTNVDTETARIVTDLTAVALGRERRFHVMTNENLREVIALEADKQLLSCDEEAASCLVEIAGALGARLVVSGSVGQLGDVFVVNASVYDSEKNQSLGREAIEVRSKAELPARIDEMVGALVARIEGRAAPRVESSPFASPWFIGGASLGAVAALSAVALGAFALVDHATLGDRAASTAAKDEALRRGPLLAGGAVVGGALAASGIGLALIPVVAE